jgi:hypothetical protein
MATTTTLTVDAGLLGEIDLTVEYRYSKGRAATYIDPPEPAEINIISVKFEGVEIDPVSDKLAEIIKEHCLDDWEGDGIDVDALIDKMKDERLMPC